MGSLATWPLWTTSISTACPSKFPSKGWTSRVSEWFWGVIFYLGPTVGGRWYSQNCHVNNCGKWMIHHEIWGFPKPIFPICHSGLLVNPPWQTRLDQGLTVSAHYLAQAVYEAPTDQDEPLSALEVVPRLLANCSCVEDVIKLLESVKVVAPKLLVVGFDLYVFCFKLTIYSVYVYIYI